MPAGLHGAMFSLLACMVPQPYSLNQLALCVLCYAVLALPCHAWSLRYLWTFKPQSMALLLLSVPMALLAPLLGWDLPALQYFGASGAVLAMILFFSMKHVKHVGMKVI